MIISTASDHRTGHKGKGQRAENTNHAEPPLLIRSYFHAFHTISLLSLPDNAYLASPLEPAKVSGVITRCVAGRWVHRRPSPPPQTDSYSNGPSRFNNVECPGFFTFSNTLAEAGEMRLRWRIRNTLQACSVRP